MLFKNSGLSGKDWLACGCTKNRHLLSVRNVDAEFNKEGVEILRGASRIAGVLSRFAGPVEPGLEPSEILRVSVENLQRFYGLDQTGSLDEVTRFKLNVLLCYHMSYRETYGRREHVVQDLCRWSSKQVYYRFGDPSSDPVEGGDPFDGVREAIRIWNDEGRVEFLPESGNNKANIEIGWLPRASYGGRYFDSGAAHADFPDSCGIFDEPKPVHFNDELRWGFSAGVNIVGVALHELGHVLGFVDLQIEETVMNGSFFEGSGSRRKIHPIDKAAYALMYP